MGDWKYILVNLISIIHGSHIKYPCPYTLGSIKDSFINQQNKHSSESINTNFCLSVICVYKLIQISIKRKQFNFDKGGSKVCELQ